MKRTNAVKTVTVSQARAAPAKKSVNVAQRSKIMGPEMHPSHEAELPRINRIIGQLEGVKKMIDERRYCPEILIQLRAIRSAVRAVEGNILKTHLQHCVVQTFASEAEKEAKIEELKQLFDRFES